jgi:hypothetical protein
VRIDVSACLSRRTAGRRIDNRHARAGRAARAAEPARDPVPGYEYSAHVAGANATHLVLARHKLAVGQSDTVP